MLILCYGKLGEVKRVAEAERTSQPTVTMWRDRFPPSGIGELKDEARPGRPTSLPASKINMVLCGVMQPLAGRTRWSIRTMARHAGVPKSRVQALWSQNDLKPHLTRTFKLSNDPHQCLALQRSQPGLPSGMGHIRTRIHDYTRHRTVTLFAALGYLESGSPERDRPESHPRRVAELLKQIERETPPDLALHLIMDNYATHKHPVVKAWPAKHPRFHLHFTSTGSSWLNLVERFFLDLTVDVVRDGSFQSMRELTTAIEIYLAERNLFPEPHRWRADGASILRKIYAARTELEGKAIKRSEW